MSRTTLLICVLATGITGQCLAAVVNPDFEIGESTTPNLPTTFGDWSGDVSQIVGSENGINPNAGNGMLRFEWSTQNNSAAGFSSSEVWQLIDLSGNSQIANGNITATAAAMFNSVPGDAETDRLFTVSMFAFNGSAASFPSLLGSQLDRSDGGVVTDSDTSTWEQASTTFLLPTSTTFLALRVTAHEDVFNDTSGTEFDGQYADSVTFFTAPLAVPEPSLVVPTLMMVAGIGLRRRKQI